ncbi:MAG: ATP-dependent sacrificial sulfur transferase LarE [Desulfomonilia bacterium]|nr:ATP-dependent sacrificial sulfur transferase LarE [Desulfomonilia bacterium]
MTIHSRLDASIRKKKNLVVLFSGGLDSTLLARLAHDAMGDGCVALTIDSPIMARHELAHAREVAEFIGITHVIVPLCEWEEDPAFVQNPADRCYLCKKIRHSRVRAWATDHGFETIAEGTNATDLEDYRPGLEASTQAGIWQPFIEHHVTKQMIRDLSRELGLATWDMPNTVCLCSRFPCGLSITPERLAMVEEAEDVLRGLGFKVVRVRIFPYETAVVELDDHQGALQSRDLIVERLRALGFTFVTLDLEGFESGKMNRVIS